MNKQALILIPNPKSTIAPKVQFFENQLNIDSESDEIYSYAVSTGYGSVIKRGKFQGDIKLLLQLISTNSIYQLDVFNLNCHFTYSFVSPGMKSIS